MIKSEIVVPLLNANEPEARLIAVHVKDGQPVDKNDLLFTVETTKAASDIQSPEAGFIRLIAKIGATVTTGEKIAVITETSDEKLDTVSFLDVAPPVTGSIRITKPARLLADSLGLDVTSFPVDRLITEEMVRQAAGATQNTEIKLPEEDLPYLLVFGAGGHAKSILDMVKQINQFTIAGILDDDFLLTGKQVLGIPVIGSRALLPELRNQGVKLAANGVGGILDINIRIRVFKVLEDAGYSFPVLIHPRAAIEPSAKIKNGVQVFANAYIGSETILEEKCMINTNAVISHDCIIGSYTHIAPGALLAGQVHVGANTLVGMGVTTAIGVQIGDRVRIGNGAIILTDVPDRTIIQAGRFWTGKAGS